MSWSWFKYWFLDNFTAEWALVLICLAALFAFLVFAVGLGVWAAALKLTDL